jgi:hypothetical protein
MQDCVWLSRYLARHCAQKLCSHAQTSTSSQSSKQISHLDAMLSPRLCTPERTALQCSFFPPKQAARKIL